MIQREMPDELKATGREWEYFREQQLGYGHWWYNGLDMVLLGENVRVVLHDGNRTATVDGDTFAEAWATAQAMLAVGERR